MNGDFAQHADEENRTAPSMTPDPIPPNVDPVQWLIDRVQGVIAESVQMGTEPLSTKAGVLAQLYQAQALREISARLDAIHDAMHNIDATTLDGILSALHSIRGVMSRHSENV